MRVMVGQRVNGHPRQAWRAGARSPVIPAAPAAATTALRVRRWSAVSGGGPSGARRRGRRRGRVPGRGIGVARRRGASARARRPPLMKSRGGGKGRRATGPQRRRSMSMRKLASQRRMPGRAGPCRASREVILMVLWWRPLRGATRRARSAAMGEFQSPGPRSRCVDLMVAQRGVVRFLRARCAFQRRRGRMRARRPRAEGRSWHIRRGRRMGWPSGDERPGTGVLAMNVWAHAFPADGASWRVRLGANLGRPRAR